MAAPCRASTATPGLSTALDSTGSASLAEPALWSSCPWRLAGMDGQGCSRYFDCPSHLRKRGRVERAELTPSSPATSRRLAPPRPFFMATTQSLGSVDGFVPRWQPDADVTICPICHSQFSIFVRKHHCRKCGRVVCNSCSPHRITIPHKYTVQRLPPISSLTDPSPSQSASSSLDTGSSDGGERVRLCNPCVPDPNTTPPLPRGAADRYSSRPAHSRSQSSLAGALSAAGLSSRLASDPYFRNRSATVQQNWSVASPTPASYGTHLQVGRLTARSPPGFAPSLPPASPYAATSRTQRSLHPGRSQTVGLAGPSSSLGPSSPSRLPSPSRWLVPAGQEAVIQSQSPPPLLPLQQQQPLAEDDECPVCHRELPSRSLVAYESLRETHVSACILTHSSYGTSSGMGAYRNGSGGSRSQRRTGMFPYLATEKDCVDTAECTICLEEFEVGVSMARLECLCRFHRPCISAWFVNHPGRCPVHQHDGFGF